MNNEWNEVALGQSRLVTHMGGRQSTWDEILGIVTPPPTDSWVPIPHAQVVKQVSETLDRTGLKVRESAYATYKDGARFFGLLGLDVKGGDGDYQLVVGLRNSHDKSFPVGLVVGSRVFVCDNLAFSSEIQVTRRHTKRLTDDLPRLIATACGKINDNRFTQERRFDHYKSVALGDMQVHDLLVQAIDVGAIGPTALPRVLQEWRAPTHPEFAERPNAWRLWNGFTEVLKEVNAAKLSRRTIALQGLFDTTLRFDPTPSEADLAWEREVAMDAVRGIAAVN